MNRSQCIVLNPSDNVGILVPGGKKGSAVLISGKVADNEIILQSDVPSGHKIALYPIEENNPVVKSGQIIGLAAKSISIGDHVHNHNITAIDNSFFTGNYIKPAPCNNIEDLPKSFMGYFREDGRIGVRNYLLVISSSNCAASVVKKICNYFSFKDFSGKNIDGIVPLTYAGGCALSKNGSTYHVFNTTLLGWLDHPNVIGAVIIGLGCEVITEKGLVSEYRERRKNKQGSIPITSFSIQEAGGTHKTVEKGISEVEKMLNDLPSFERKEAPVSSLILGLNCGGSDSLSAITANPALGIAGDFLVANDGTIVLAEYPECHGAEKQMLQRCIVDKDKKTLQEIIDWWKNYAANNKVSLDDNLSSGNKEGGISTILEKSLGAITKGGSTPITQVIRYAERISRKGLVFMDTPGYDPVSVTGLIAGGCQMIAFTTGRGSVYGCSVAPVIKITTNSDVFNHMRDDMDINAGKIIEGTIITDVSREIYNFVIAVASGEKTGSERNGIGWEEFVPWQVGETL